MTYTKARERLREVTRQGSIVRLKAMVAQDEGGSALLTWMICVLEAFESDLSQASGARSESARNGEESYSSLLISDIGRRIFYNLQRASLSRRKDEWLELEAKVWLTRGFAKSIDSSNNILPKLPGQVTKLPKETAKPINQPTLQIHFHRKDLASVVEDHEVWVGSLNPPHVQDQSYPQTKQYLIRAT
ncbi:hypothetical protein GmHk_03G008319 [Glycine max]|nr:hypothetical protein GmHk_03G008319 [Glycine max]